MKKNKLAAIIVGAVLITGSTVSISAASMGKAHHKSHSSKGSQNSAFLRGVTSGDSWAALHSVLNPNEKKNSPVAPILAPSGILPSNTSTVTISSDEDGINEEHGTNPMTKSHGDSHENSDHSQDDSND